MWFVLTAAEIAAYLGVTPGRVRQLIVQHGVLAIGRRGRASLYDLDAIARHTGTADRLGATL